MSDKLSEILGDLTDECDQLEALLEPPDDEVWLRQTTATGWAVATQVAHLAWTDEVAVTAATDRAGWDALVLRALEDPAGFIDAEAATGAMAEPKAILERWRASRTNLTRTLKELPPGSRIPWFGPPMSPTSMATARFMETWAHGRDVADALDVVLEPHDRVRHVVHLGVRTRGYSFASRGLDVPAEEPRVELVLPGGALLVYGPEDAVQSVRGSAYDFGLLVTQRVHRADCDLVATGTDADRWLDVAQAFAGPTGPGREPR